MKIGKLSKAFILVVAVFGFTQGASAKVLRITGFGGVNLPLMMVKPTPQLLGVTSSTIPKPYAKQSYGGLVTLDVIPILKIDAGLLYSKIKFGYYDAIADAIPNQLAEMTYETSQWFFPLLARAEVGPLSFGAGLFYSMVGKNALTVTNTDGKNVLSTASGKYTDAFAAANNQGFLFSIGLRIKLPVLPIGFMADAWYMHGLKELSKTASVGDTARQGTLQFLVGVSLYL